MPRTYKLTSRARGAMQLDRYALYEKAVQEPEADLARLEQALKRAGRPALRLREDFSGTALLSATWVAADPKRTAVAVDLDPETHAWAREHRLPKLGEAAPRLKLVQADVREAPRGPFDAVLACNYSYQVFFTRQELKGYFASVRRSLAPGGVFMLDSFGGWLTQQGLVEKRRLGDGVTYVWDQDEFDPITHRIRCSISFEATRGRRVRPFFYEWRLWTLPELTELLEETGFEGIEVHWDVEPPDRKPRYLPRKAAQAAPAWVAWITARRAGRKMQAGTPPKHP
jgi:SAM-dependent methyltransferase